MEVSPRTGHRARTIFCDFRSRNARAIFSNTGLLFTDSPDDADLIWMRRGYQNVQYRLQQHQLLNHIPTEQEMTNKGRLTEHLKAYDRSRTRPDLRLKDFYPETFCLYREEDRTAFRAQLPPQDRRDNLWILKPDGRSMGKGVRILWQFDAFRDLPLGPDERINIPGLDLDEKYIAQRYIQDPLLLQGRKSEIRLYWLIASLSPLLVLLYREGTVRLNSCPYRLEDFDNPLIHITNAYQQKTHPEYDPTRTLKWRFSQLQAYLTDELGIADSDFVEHRLKPLFKTYLTFVVDAVRQSLTQTPTEGIYFGLYGADLILDSTLHPWLTEVQKGPGLSHNDPVKKQVVPNMLREAVRIAYEVQDRKRTGQSLAQLDSCGGFEWIINTA